MIKFKQGWIGNDKTGEKKDIVVKSALPNKVKDMLVGGLILVLGVTYLTFTAFKNGAQKHEDAEMETLTDLGLIGEVKEDA